MRILDTKGFATITGADPEQDFLVGFWRPLRITVADGPAGPSTQRRSTEMRTSDATENWTGPALLGASNGTTTETATPLPATANARESSEHGQSIFLVTDYPDRWPGRRGRRSPATLQVVRLRPDRHRRPEINPPGTSNTGDAPSLGGVPRRMKMTPWWATFGPTVNRHRQVSWPRRSLVHPVFERRPGRGPG
jgi:hypothetical protein